MKLFIVLLVCIVATKACTYTCWKTVNTAAWKFAACTGQGTVPVNGGSHTFIQENCGQCPYTTDRAKGMFMTVPNSWCWIYKGDLAGDEYSCGGPEIEYFKSQQRSATKAVGCPAPGLYHPVHNATVRGDNSDPYGCALHHFLGWLNTNQHFKLSGPCSADCFWCKGYAYGDVNARASIECSELVQG